MPFRRRPGAWAHWLTWVLLGWLWSTQAYAVEAIADDPVRWMPRSADSLIRVLSWNVNRERFFEHRARTTALLRLADADILLLDEMPEGATPQAIEQTLQQVSAGRWHVVLGNPGGNFERASVSARWPLQRIKRFDQLRYPRRAMRRWIAAAGPHAERLRRSLPLGIAAVGAVSEIHGQRVLLVSFDLQCCGDQPGAWEEERRLLEARLLHEAIDATRREQSIDAVLLGGDANNVQGARVVELLRGAGSGFPLHEAEARRADGSDWSWDGRGTPFASKRIDHLFHAGALRLRQARLLDSEEFDPAQAAAFGVDVDASRLQSPHRPIVADFTLVAAAPTAARAD